MAIGHELLTARRQAGLSRQEIAQRIDVSPSIIVLLEHDALDRLPADTDLVTVVGAYATEVGLDPEPLLRTLEAPPSDVREEWIVHPDSVDAFPEEQPRDSEPHAPAAPADTPQEAAPPPPPPPRPPAPEPPIDIDSFDRARADDSPAAIPAFVTEPPTYREHRRQPGRAAIPALALLAAAGWGAYLYKVFDPLAGNGTSTSLFSSSSVPGSEQPLADALPPGGTSESAAPTTTAPAQTTSAAEAPAKLPATDTAASRQQQQTESSSAARSAVPANPARERQAVPGATTPPVTASTQSAAAAPSSPPGSMRDVAAAAKPTEHSTPGSASAPPRNAAAAPPPASTSAVNPAATQTGRVTRDSASATTPAAPVTARPNADRAAIARPRSAASAPTIAGPWTLNVEVEDDAADRAGTRFGYLIQLRQQGDHVSGVGRLVSTNGAPLEGLGHATMAVDGKISGDRLLLTFTDVGASGTRSGRLVLVLQDDGVLRGRFATGSPQSSGPVEAHRSRE